MYNILQQMFSNRMKDVPQHKKTHVKQQKLDSLKEQVLFQYTLDQDAKRFPLRLAGLENMTNFLLKSQNGQLVSKY